MAQRKDSLLRQKTSVVDGAMVDYLQKRFVFVCDVDVVQVDQAVGASRQQNVGACGVELKLKILNYITLCSCLKLTSVTSSL